MSARVELLLFTAGWGTNHFATLLIVYRLGKRGDIAGMSLGIAGLLLAARAATTASPALAFVVAVRWAAATAW
jgi:hypothetical protein